MKYLYMRASTNETKQSLQRQEKFGRDNNIPEANWFKEYASGANITLVAKYLGHTKVDETLNTYSHMFKNKLDDIVNLINDLNKQ